MNKGPADKSGNIANEALVPAVRPAYGRLISELSDLLEQSRRMAARSVNAVLTATYWQIGQRIVEHEQHGTARAEYGEEVLLRLGKDLAARFGRGFSTRNLRHMRSFYLDWEIWQTSSAKLLPADMLGVFPLSWSHYVRLISVDKPLVHYAMGGIKAKVFATHYLTALPDAEALRQEILTTQHALEKRAKRIESHS